MKGKDHASCRTQVGAVTLHLAAVGCSVGRVRPVAGEGTEYCLRIVLAPQVTPIGFLP